MANRETVSRLAQLMKAAGVDRDTALNISLRLRHPGLADQLIDWMEKNKATPVEICEKALEIWETR